MQECYDEIEKCIKEMAKKYGKPRGKISTNDKLGEKARMLMKRREELRKKRPKEGRDKIELGELRKTIRKEIFKTCLMLLLRLLPGCPTLETEDLLPSA